MIRLVLVVFPALRASVVGLALLLLLPQEKLKLIPQKDAVAAAKAEALKWNAACWLARIECLAAGENSVDLNTGKYAGWRITFAARTDKLGELDTAFWETFDGGAAWTAGEKKISKQSFGLLPLPDKTIDNKAAAEMARKYGVKTKLVSLKLEIERGWPIWRSTTADEPTVVIDGVSGKAVGVVKTTLNDLLDKMSKPSSFADAIAAVTKQLTDWGVTEWGLLSVEGRGFGLPNLGQALNCNAWTIVLETTKPSACRFEFGYHNQRLSQWNALVQPTGEKTTPAADVALAKAAGFVAGHPLITDWARNHRMLNSEVTIDPDRMNRKEVRVRLIDGEKTDDWANAVLDLTTGRVKDFMKQ